MHFQQDTIQDAYFIQSYTSTQLKIAEHLFTKSLIISKDTLIENWPINHFTQLEHTHFTSVIGLKPEILILGTGNNQHFASAIQLQTLINGHIAVECMTTAAACRTYNILVAEQRSVVAALIIEQHNHS
jgi:uncharacterized protein